MKHVGKWLLKVISKALVIALVIMIILFASNPLRELLRNVQGEIRLQSTILKQKMESSKRLEVTTVDEEGTLEAKTSVVLLGTVGSTTIRYRYSASIGIDLGKVEMSAEGDSLVFLMPDPEILNDGIEPLEINRNDLFSKAIDKSTETLLNEQRLKCRDEYMSNSEYTERNWKDMVKAFRETICGWLENYGERHYRFEFIRADGQAAE